MDVFGILTSIGIASALAMLTPFITARAKIKIDAENLKRSVSRIKADPIINNGAFFRKINFPGGDTVIGPCFISDITDVYIKITDWATGDVTSFEGNEFAQVQYWGFVRADTNEVCNVNTDWDFLESYFGKFAMEA